MAQQFQPQSVVQGTNFVNPGQVVLTNIYPGTQRPREYRSKVAIALGSIQIIIGAICIIFNIVQLGLWYGTINTIGYGIWCGAIFITAGILEVCSGRPNPTYCVINSTMVMSIIAACFSAVIFGFSITDASIAKMASDMSSYRYGYYNPFWETTLGLSCVIAILSVIETAVAITTSVLCCKAVCRCCDPNPIAFVVPVNAIGNQQAMYTTQPQLDYQHLGFPPTTNNSFPHPVASNNGGVQVVYPPAYQPPTSEAKRPLEAY